MQLGRGVAEHANSTQGGRGLGLLSPPLLFPSANRTRGGDCGASVKLVSPIVTIGGSSDTNIVFASHFHAAAVNAKFET